MLSGREEDRKKSLNGRVRNIVKQKKGQIRRARKLFKNKTSSWKGEKEELQRCRERVKRK